MDQLPPLEFTPTAMQHLEETRKWTLFLSILGTVFIGLMLFVLAILALLSPMELFPAQGVITMVALVLVALLYVFPIYYLFRFSACSKQAITTRDTALLTKAMQYLKLEFRYMGIMTIVVLGLYVVGIVVMVVVGGIG